MKNLLLTLMVIGSAMTPFDKALTYCSNTISVPGWSWANMDDAEDCISDMVEFIIENEQRSGE